ncbi:MAG: WecB/TagA/CpsF family glycosyltransferase [Oscillospiraceae bacterium]
MMEQTVQTPHSPKRVSVIGVPISAVNLEGSVRYIEDNLRNAKGNYICVSNVHHCDGQEDEGYRQIQTNSFLSVPDGKPLSVVGKRRGYPEMDRVTGPNLMRRLFEDSAARGYTHYLYGNTAKNLQILTEQLQRDYPHLQIVGYEPSVFHELSDQEADELAQRVNAASPDFLWVGIGAPHQEKLCARLAGKVNSLMVGVGGAFNILGGIIPEAPSWMQNLSLEWLYRLLQEPKRLFKRYFVTNTKFLLYLFHLKK